MVSFSSAVGSTLGGWLSDTIAHRAPLYIGGVFMVLAGLATLYLPDSSENHDVDDLNS